MLAALPAAASSNNTAEMRGDGLEMSSFTWEQNNPA